MSAIWLPGSGMVPFEVRRVDAAVREYDEHLRFGRNEETGQWCIFRLTGPSTPPLPLLGWNDIPHPDDALKRLHQTDSWRRGEEILDEMNRHNDAIDEVYEYAAQEGEGIAAEALEWGTRQMKGAEAHSIVVPMSRQRNRMGGWS